MATATKKAVKKPAAKKAVNHPGSFALVFKGGEKKTHSVKFSATLPKDMKGFVFLRVSQRQGQHDMYVSNDILEFLGVQKNGSVMVTFDKA